MNVFIAKLSLCFILISTSLLYGQHDLNQKIDDIKKIKDPHKKIKQLDSLLHQQDTLQKTLALGKLYNTIGNTYAKSPFKNYTKAITYSKKAIAVRSLHKATHLKLYNSSRFNLSWLYRKTEKAKKEHELLLQIIQDNGTDKYTYSAYTRLAKITKQKGDYYTSLHYLNTILGTKPFLTTIKKEVKTRLNIIETYAKMYESITESKDTLVLNTLEIYSNFVEVNFDKSQLKEKEKYNMYTNLAIVYAAFGKTQKAIDYYKNALQFYIAEKDSTKTSKVFINIGHLYAKEKQYNTAVASFNNALKYATEKEQIAAAYDNLGDYNPSISAKERISLFYKALYTLLDKEYSETLPSLNTIKASENKQDILVYLSDLASQQVQTYKEKHDIFYLESAKKTLHLIDDLVTLIRYESIHEQTKLFWINKGVDSYMLAVEVCYLLNEKDDAIYFMEKNKALLLQEQIKDFQTKLASDIPEAEIAKEYRLYYESSRLEKEFAQYPDSIQTKEAFYKSKRNYTMFMDSLQKIYPEYVKSKFEVAILSAQEIKNTLVSNTTAFVEYILNEKQGYGIYYAQNEMFFFEIPKVVELQEQITTLKTYFSKRTLSKNKIQEYQKLGVSIFKKILPFDNALAKIKDKSLIVVPDYTLQNIPFEALSITTAKNLSESYLIQQTAISYLQSASTLKQILQKENNPKHQILGIAPTTFKDNTLVELLDAEIAMEHLTNYNCADLLTHENATKNQVKEIMKDYTIIHFNTHAGITKEKLPWIALHDGNITLDELYGIENQANLIILDACKSNDGKQIEGEGIINLSRGFFYNGAQSVLAAMWNVNEKSGNTILQTFYHYLSEGKSKNEALQLAKKKYLASQQYAQVLPYYWATFTLTGTTDSIVLQQKSYTSLLLFFAAIVMLILFFFRKKQSAKSQNL